MRLSDLVCVCRLHSLSYPDNSTFLPFLRKKTNKTCSISPSRVVPHRSTTDTRGSLTSLFGWEAVTLPDVAARIMACKLFVYIS